ncbi:hypothetical protein [Lacticaseibacillus rhamnosus]|uniref:hypothetical protein n=1 Tax=Lacticaseibacillus rhamnosus TaxID=47715 RepID=UPI0022AAFF91|nr:hypothetical protein [Lacticaseibacillus rhamnosus]
MAIATKVLTRRFLGWQARYDKREPAKLAVTSLYVGRRFMPSTKQFWNTFNFSQIIWETKKIDLANSQTSRKG